MAKNVSVPQIRPTLQTTIVDGVTKYRYGVVRLEQDPGNPEIWMVWVYDDEKPYFIGDRNVAIWEFKGSAGMYHAARATLMDLREITYPGEMTYPNGKGC